jgi:hypothetical protein
MSNFENPGGGGDMLPVADMVGKPLIVCPLEHVLSIQTVHGERDAISVDVVDLSTGAHYSRVLWFGGKVIGATKNKVGSLIVCTVQQGVASKPGQNPPWELVGLADRADIVAAAQAWVDANPGVLTTPPAPVAPMPVQVAPVAPMPATQPII